MLYSAGKPIGNTSLKPVSPDRENSDMALGNCGLGGGTGGPSELVGLRNGGSIELVFSLFWIFLQLFLGGICAELPQDQ
jgi:hypothetical protein